MTIPAAMRESIDMILRSCGGKVFYSSDFAQALILSNDDQWVACVSEDGCTAESYLSTEPIENIISRVEDPFTRDDLPDLQGFTTGFVT